MLSERQSVDDRSVSRWGSGQGTEWTKYIMDREQIFLYKVQNGQSSDFSVSSNIGLGLGLGLG